MQVKLKEWRRIVADALSEGLAEPNGPDVTVYPAPVGSVSVPCVIVASGGLDYVTSNADDAYVVKDFIAHDATFCRALVQVTAYMFGGTPYNDATYDQVDDWIDRLDSALKLVQQAVPGADITWTRATPMYNIDVGGTPLTVSAVEIKLTQI